MQAGINQINYLFLSRGKIVKTGVIQKQIGTETTLNVDITADMAPKCRILAFFVRNGEMASDSVLMDVENGYKNEVLLNTDPAPDQTFRPGQDLAVKMKTSTKSVVGLLAVDQSIYYLRNESRVTNEKVFSDIGSFDLGCGLGSGRNNKDVFDRAGLSMLTDAAVPVSKREDLLCGEDPKRRRRRSVAGGISLLDKKCCQGICCQKLRSIAGTLPKGTKCKELQKHIPSVCWPDFYSCCLRNFASRGRSAIGPDDEFEVRPDDIDDDVTQLTTREFFPESWIWVKAETNDDGFLEQGFTLPDSITTWEISAIAMNSQTGFGLSNTVNIQSRMNLFIHLKMPPSVQRHEQTTVYAVLYNFNARETHVNLFFIGHASFCSMAKPDERSERLSVVVKGNDAVAIPFTVIPLQVGDSPIEVQAFTVDFGDKIRKNLSVVPEGLQKQETISIVLDPQGIMDSDDPRGKKIVEVKRIGVQLNSLKVALPDNLVPGFLRVMIYVTGNLMAPGVKDMVENGLNNLIVMPRGCGEQTMIYMAPLVYVLKYLYTIKDGVTDEIERKAYNFMRAGYRNELRYRRNDNSYSVWGQKTAPMTWLSAFVNKVFCQASAYIKDDIDSHLICSTFKFLESKQVADGSFAEALPVYQREMRGEVDNKVALTAFVVISLTECSSQCTNTDTKVLSKATSFLEKAVPGIKAGNLMAIVAYALALTGSPGKNNAYSKLVEMLKRDRKDDRSVAYIPDGGLASQVEATSYALLTMIAMNKIKDAGPLVIWLTSMRNARGSFISTQDTVVALQALSEYSSKASTGEMDLRITVASSKIDRKIFRIQKSDALVRQQQDITKAAPGTVFVQTKGTGVAQLQLELTYNVPDEGKDCQYDVTITTREEIDNRLNDDAIPIKPAKPKKNKKNKNKGKCKGKKKHSKKCKKGNRKTQGDKAPNRLRISICIRHNFNNGSVMTMAEVGLLSGFKADNESLKNLLDNVKPKVYQYEISDRSVVFYLEKVTTTKSCFGFAMARAFKVGALQAVPVKVYDYYEPGQICTKFYRPSRNSALLKVICEDEDQCSCSQGSCPKQRSTNPKPLQRTACLHSDYVFTGIVVDIEDQNSMQKIAFRVVDVYKTYSNGLKKDIEVYMYKLTNCDYPEIKSGEQYLIMVKKSEVYVMNEDTYVLEWPGSVRKARKVKNALNQVRQGAVCDEMTA
ncbi:venom factor-like [Rhopilema esculentum]|uniref:venom factor-like n=1 Tax=Rhopilema esculentum TaxID=499914 RepID=UPI0031DAD465